MFDTYGLRPYIRIIRRGHTALTANTKGMRHFMQTYILFDDLHRIVGYTKGERGLSGTKIEYGRGQHIVGIAKMLTPTQARIFAHGLTIINGTPHANEWAEPLEQF